VIGKSGSGGEHPAGIGDGVTLKKNFVTAHFICILYWLIDGP
jgi:hypothetical protein